MRDFKGVFVRLVRLTVAVCFFLTSSLYADSISLYQTESTLRAQAFKHSPQNTATLASRLSSIRDPNITHEDVLIHMKSSLIRIDRPCYESLLKLFVHDDFKEVYHTVRELNRDRKVAFRFAKDFGTLAVTLPKGKYTEITGEVLSDEVRAVMVLDTLFVPENPTSPPVGLARLWEATLAHEMVHIENPIWDGIRTEFIEEIIATLEKLKVLVNISEEERSGIKRLIKKNRPSFSVKLIELADSIAKNQAKYIDDNGTFNIKAIEAVIAYVYYNYADFQKDFDLSYRLKERELNAFTIWNIYRTRNRELSEQYYRQKGYYEKEQAANHAIRKRIQANQTPRDFEVKGKLRPPKKGYSQRLPDVNSQEYNQLNQRGVNLLKERTVASGFSAGGISKRSGGLMRAGFSFEIPEADPYSRSFLAWKIGIIKNAIERYKTKIPIVILTSYLSHNLIQDILEDNHYFGLDKDDIILVNQGITKHLVPSPSFLEEYLSIEEEKRGPQPKLENGIKYEKTLPGWPLIFGDQTVAAYPPGHFGFIRSAIIDGTLARLKRKGVRYILHSNMNNLLGTVIKPAKIGLFDEACEKALKNNEKPPVVLVEVGENRDEKGGFPTEVTEPDGTTYIRLIEKGAWPAGVPTEGYAHINTANYIFSVDGLLDLYGLSDNYDDRPGFGTQAFVKMIDKAVPVPHMLDKEEIPAPVGDAKYLVYKAEQALGDLTAIASRQNRVVWLEVDRDRRFSPTKALAEIPFYMRLLNSELKDNVSLSEPLPPRGLITYVKSSSGGENLSDRISAIQGPMVRYEEVFKRIKAGVLPLSEPHYDYLKQLLKHRDFREVDDIVHDFNRNKKVAFRFASEFDMLAVTVPKAKYTEITGESLTDEAKMVVVLNTLLLPKDLGSPPGSLAELWEATLRHQGVHIENPIRDGIRARFLEEVMATLDELKVLIRLRKIERNSIKNLVRSDSSQSLSNELIRLADKIAAKPETYIENSGTFSLNAIAEVVGFVSDIYADFKESFEMTYLLLVGDLNPTIIFDVYQRRNQERTAEYFKQQGYYEKEQAASHRLRERIRSGEELEDFKVKGELRPPKKGYSRTLPDVNSKEYKELNQRGVNLLKEGVVSSGFSTGGLSKRSGGLMRAGFSFEIPEADPHPRSFLAWNIGIIKKAMERYDFRTPIMIQTSYISHQTVMDILEDNQYFGLNKEDIILINPGMTECLVPPTSYLKECLENIEETRGPQPQLEKGISYEQSYPGRPLIFGDGTQAVFPPGHLGFIRAAVIDGTLARLKRKGVRYILHSNMNNLLGTIIEPATIGLFDEACEKALENNEKSPVMLLEVTDRLREFEKVGFPTEVVEPDGTTYIRAIEKEAWPSGVSVDGFAHISIANYIFSVDGLLDLYGLSDDYDDKPKFGTQAFIEMIDKAVLVPHILSEETVVAPVGKVEYLVYKTGQALGDLTAIAGKQNRVVWLKVNRDNRFAPTKILVDIDRYMYLLDNKLKGNVSLPEPLPERGLITYAKSSSAGEVIYLDDVVEATTYSLVQEIRSARDEKKLAFVLLKTDAKTPTVRQNIIEDLERAGFSIIRILEPMRLGREEAERLYAEHKGKYFLEGLVEYMTDGTVVPIILKGPKDAWKKLKDLAGAPDGTEPGSLRAKYGVEKVPSTSGVEIMHNKIHAPDSFKTTLRELSLVLKKAGIDLGSVPKVAPYTVNGEIKNAYAEKRAYVLRGEVKDWQNARSFDFARAYEMLELIKGMNVKLTESLGGVDLYKVLEAANIILINSTDKKFLEEVRAGITVDADTIYLFTSDLDSLSDTELLGVLINAATKLAARKKTQQLNRTWTKTLAKNIDNIAKKTEARYAEDLAKQNIAILTRPEDFDPKETEPIQRRHKEHFDLLRFQLSPTQNEQLDAVDRMWDRYYEHMKKSTIDALIFTCRNNMFEIEKERIEKERGITFPADAVVVLVGLAPEQCQENLNSLGSGLARGLPALRQMGIDYHSARIINTQLTGPGTRNEPFTHSSGLGDKENMPTPSGLPYLTRTLMETYQFMDPDDKRPYMVMRANDQIVLCLNPAVFKNDFGYTTLGQRLLITEDVKKDPKHPHRNNCLMQTDKDGLILDGMEKPEGSLDSYIVKDKDGKEYAPASLFIRRFTPGAIDAFIENFFSPGETETTRNIPFYRAYPMAENFMLTEAGNSPAERWKKRKEIIRLGKGVPLKDWMSMQRRAKAMRDKVAVAFGDMGDDAIFIDTGTDTEYHNAFIRTLNEKVLQAHFDVVPVGEGNILIRSEIGEDVRQTGLIYPRIRRVFGIDAKIKSGCIGQNAVLLNTIAKESKIGNNTLTACTEKKSETLEVPDDNLFTNIWDKRDLQKVDILYPLDGDIRADFNKPQFGKNKDISFANLEEVQDKGMTIALQHRTKLPMSEIFDERPILIIGGAGYVGTFLTRAICASGYPVVVYDNLSIGHKEAIDKINQLVGKVDFVQGDVLDSQGLSDVIRKYNPRAVIMASALSVVPESVKDPARYYYANVLGQIKVSEAMRENKVPFVILSGSAAAYGKVELAPGQSITEAFPARPINPYGRTKVLMEKILREYHSKFGINWISLRYFNVWGASRDGKFGEDHRTPEETHLVPGMDLAMIKGKEIHWDLGPGKGRVPVEDLKKCPDGTTIRDYINAEDLAIAHILAMQHVISSGETGIFNLGTDKGTSAKQMRDAFVNALRNEMPDIDKRLTIEGKRPGDPDVLIASNRKAKDTFGWIPLNTDITETIRNVHNWHSSHSDGYGDIKQAPAPRPELDLLNEILGNLDSNDVLSNDLKFEIVAHLAGDIVRTKRKAFDEQKQAESGKAVQDQGKRYEHLDALISRIESMLDNGVTLATLPANRRGLIRGFKWHAEQLTDPVILTVAEKIDTMLDATAKGRGFSVPKPSSVTTLFEQQRYQDFVVSTAA